MKLHIDPSAGKICDLQKRNQRLYPSPIENESIFKSKQTNHKRDTPLRQAQDAIRGKAWR